MIFIKTILDPFYKVLFGMFAVVTMLLLSPIIALAILYVMFVNPNYLEYLNPEPRFYDEGDE